MSKKDNKKDEDTKILKTTDLKDFINVLKEIDKDVSDDIENKNKAKTNNSNKKRNFYLGFNERFFINIGLLLITIVFFVYSLLMSFSVSKEELLKYKVSSNIDYKIYLKRNDFYETPYLEKGMVYVASLIDKININYNYKFDISKQSDINFNYKVVANLVIANKNNSNIFFEKEYVLKDSKKEEMKNNTVYTIDEETVIDYSYYNNLANKFRSKYAVDTTSYLDVYLLVNEKNAENSNFVLNKDSKAVLTIPLSMQEVNISLNEADIDENNQVLANQKVFIKNIGNVIISAILLVFIIILNIKFIKKILLLANKKSVYDNYINKILRGYDRIIVNIKTIPNFKRYNKIKVESFQELIDVRDNFKLPINYYVITEHQKSEFFIVNNNDIYIYVVKAVDLEKGKKNEKK